MAGKRKARLNEQLKREISEILRTEVRDPRIGFPTITNVEVTSDLWLARVYVRPDPTTVEDEDFLHGLRTAAPFIRRSLGKTLQVRRIPELRFERDETLENAMRIERILQEVVIPEGGDESEGEAEGGGDE